MKQVQGRLTAFGFRTTQGEWTFDVSTVTGVSAPKPAARADAQPRPSAPPQPPGPCPPNQMKNTGKQPLRNSQQPNAETSRVRDLSHSDDDDDAFMEPLPWRQVAKKQCLNARVAVNPTGKRTKNPVKRAPALTVRCAPSSLNSFVENLTLRQRKKIIDMGFGGLLCIAADRLESRELLKFLFNRLDTKTMVLHVSKDKSINVTPFAIKQVLDLPDIGEVLHLHTHTQASKALVAFKNSVGLRESQELHAGYLQNLVVNDLLLGSSLIDDDMAITFFFVIACNKLLFPNTDNNVRCKDVYLTRDLSRLPGLNWCEAVFNDLRDAALSWQADKEKKSLSGCSIFLIILYLDNLQCAHQIGHTKTPRAKYFDQDVIHKLIHADRTKDQQGKATFGLLPLRNNINTCYHMPNSPPSSVPPYFPSLQAELHELVSQIGIGSRKMRAMQTLANFDSKAKEALRYIDIGQQILRDAHAAGIHTLRSLLHDEVHGNNSVQHHDQSHTFDAAQADDVHMYDGHSSGDNIESEQKNDVPSFRPETMQNDAHTNLEVHQGAPVDLQKEFDLLFPLVCTQVRNAAFCKEHYRFYHQCWALLHTFLILHMQVPADVPIDHVVPPVVDKGNTGTASPASSTHGIIDQPTSYLDSTAGTRSPQDTSADRTISATNVDSQTDKQDPDEVPQHNPLMVSDVQHLAGTEGTEDDALGPILLDTCTQDETIPSPSVHHRPQRLTKRPAMYVSPFKGDPQRAKAPMTKAHAVRKKFHNGMKCESDIFIRNGTREFDGTAILDSFLDDGMLTTQFMAYFVDCLRHDERHLADGGGYRVFLSPELGEYVNTEDDEYYTEWQAAPALDVLYQDIGDIDPSKVKLFLLPIMEDSYSIYCINFIHDRIDVLDSSPHYHTEYHQVLGDRIIPRLNLLFQVVTAYKIKHFTRFRRPIIDACTYSNVVDCGFYAIKFMELWNGECFHVPIWTENIRQFRSQLLFYGLYHTINEIKKLPAGLETHRPRR